MNMIIHSGFHINHWKDSIRKASLHSLHLNLFIISDLVNQN